MLRLCEKALRHAKLKEEARYRSLDTIVLLPKALNVPLKELMDLEI